MIVTRHKPLPWRGKWIVRITYKPNMSEASRFYWAVSRGRGLFRGWDEIGYEYARSEEEAHDAAAALQLQWLAEFRNKPALTDKYVDISHRVAEQNPRA